jgi:hypothetical protein
LKQWLAMLTRNYPEAVELFTVLRRETELDQVSRLWACRSLKRPEKIFKNSLEIILAVPI